MNSVHTIDGVIVCAGAYAWIVENEHALLVRYGPPDGRWSSPGGGIEVGR